MITVIALNPAVDKIYYIDNFTAGGLYRISEVVKSAGGKGMNVARVAAILGENLNIIGFKAGHTGEWLESEIRKYGVYTHFTNVKGESRINSNIIDKVSRLETEILEAGPEVTAVNMDFFMAAFKALLGCTSVLVCTGGLPSGLADDTYMKLITMAKTLGIKTVLDSSGTVLEQGIEAGPYLVKPNLRELSAYAGKTLETRDDIISVCRDIISKGVEIVAASLGEKGALLVSGETVLQAVPPEIEIVNSIGSGDSMVAGMAAGLNRNGSMEDMLRLGMACAAANATFPEIGLIDREIVEKYKKEIRIEAL